MCLCVTAFQLVHFQIAYHISAGGVISPNHTKWIAADSDLTSSIYSNRKELKTADSSGLQQHIVWQCWVKPPATLTATKVQCEGCSTRFVVICSSSDADNWKCAPLVLCIGHLRFLVRFSHTLFLIGQYTPHNFHLLLTAVRVTDYNIMYGGPNLTRGALEFLNFGALGAPKWGGPIFT